MEATEEQKRRKRELEILICGISQLGTLMRFIERAEDALNIREPEALSKEIEKRDLGSFAQQKSHTGKIKPTESARPKVVPLLSAIKENLQGVCKSAKELIGDFKKSEQQTAEDILSVNMVIEASLRQAERTYVGIKKENQSLNLLDIPALDKRYRHGENDYYATVPGQDDGNSLSTKVTPDYYEMSLQESFVAIAGLRYRVTKWDKATRYTKIAAFTLAAFGIGICVGAIMTTITHGGGIVTLPACMLASLKGIGAYFGASLGTSTLFKLHYKFFGKDYTYDIRGKQTLAAVVPMEGVVTAGLAISSGTSKNLRKPPYYKDFMAFKRSSLSIVFHLLGQLHQTIQEKVDKEKIIVPGSDAHRGLLQLVELTQKRVKTAPNRRYASSHYNKAIMTGWAIANCLENLDTDDKINDFQEILNKKIALTENKEKNPTLGQVVNMSRHLGLDIAGRCASFGLFRQKTQIARALEKTEKTEKNSLDFGSPLCYRLA